MLKKYLTRKRGADTNQNIFYLVIAVILLSAAAFGFDQALRTMARTEAVRTATDLSIQIRSVFPGSNAMAFTTASMINAGLVPENRIFSSTSVSLPYNGLIQISSVNATGLSTTIPGSNFKLNMAWYQAGSRAHGLCSYMGGDYPVGIANVVDRGVLGSSYAVTRRTCTGVNPRLEIVYFR